MSRLFCLFCLAAGTLFLASLAGCGQSSSRVDAALIAKERARFTLAQEPDGAQVIPEVRSALLGISVEHDHDGHEEHEHGEHDEAEHDHAEHDHADHDEADHDQAEHDEEVEGDEDEDSEHHDHGDHDHDEHGHEEHAHGDHDHEHEEVVVTKATDPMEVVLVGQIGGLTNPWQETQPDFPFARDQAAFFLADPQSVTEDAEHGHHHAAGEECAFCAAHAADRSSMLAMVRFLDKDGNVLPVDVRKLFDVKENDTVVVRGTARVIEGGMMVVEATGLYVRR